MNMHGQFRFASFDSLVYFFKNEFCSGRTKTREAFLGMFNCRAKLSFALFLFITENVKIRGVVFLRHLTQCFV